MEKLRENVMLTKILFAPKFNATCRTLPQWRFIKAKRLSPFSFQTKWKCNVRSLKTFTLNESGNLEKCGFITKALTQC